MSGRNIRTPVVGRIIRVRATIRGLGRLGRLISTVAVLGAACGRVVVGAPAPPNAVPWLDAPAAKPAAGAAPTASSPGSPDAPPCRSDELTITRGPVKAALGTTVIEAHLTSHGNRQCLLADRPAVDLLDSSGRQIPIQQIPYEPPAETAAHSPLPGNGSGEAILTVLVQPECSTSPGSSSVLFSQIRMHRQDQGMLTTPVDASLVDPSCPVRVSGFYIPNPVPETTSPSVLAKLVLPEYAPPGSTMIYYVTLVNNGSRPLADKDCPTYEQLLTAGARVLVDQSFKLNCNPGPLQPGDSRTYEIRMDIPSDAPAHARAKVSWRIAWGTGIFAGGSLELG